MKIWGAPILAPALCVGPAAAAIAAAGCDKNPDSPTPSSCKFPAACFASEAAPPQIDGTRPIPVQDCIAAAAWVILTTEQQVGILGQASATDPNVKAIAGQMTEDFTAALATDAPYGARELTHVDVGNVGLEGVTAVCGGP